MLKKISIITVLLSSVVALPTAIASENKTSIHIDYSEYKLPDTLAVDGISSISEKDFKKKYEKIPVAFHKESDIEANDDGVFLFKNEHNNYYTSEETREYDGQKTNNKDVFLTGTYIKLDNYDNGIGLLTFDKRYQDIEKPYDVFVSSNQTVQVPVLHTDSKETMIKLEPSYKEYYIGGNTLYKIDIRK